MINSEILSPTRRLQQKEHFRHLVQIAMSDGKIDSIEMKMLNRMGINIGLSEFETQELIDSTCGTIYSPPENKNIQFEQVYNMVQLILADGIVELGEMRLAYTFADAAGFDTDKIDYLLSFLLEGIKAGKNEHNLFVDYYSR